MERETGVRSKQESVHSTQYCVLVSRAPAAPPKARTACYWKHYGCVLVTNYRDFLLVVKEPGETTPCVEGRYRLADRVTVFRG